MTMSSAFAAEKPAQNGKYYVYYGTYTGGKNGSQGIYVSAFDAKTGKVSPPAIAAAVGSPSFLEIAPSGQTLYAIGEAAGKKGEGGGVHAFRIDPNTGKLTKLNSSTSGGAGPCHISTDAAGQFAIVANYSGGSCAAFQLKPDGSIAARSDFHQHQGSSKADPARQEKPHAHCGFFSPNGQFAYVVDLGLDQVLVYQLNRDTGKLTPRPPITMPPGTGPRHIHITPDGKTAFVCGELDMTVHVVKLDPRSGAGQVVQSLTTLPNGQKGPVKGYSTAEVRIHPSGQFVYVSNRGHDTIAGFRWDGQKLSPIGHAGDGVKTPRNFRIDPTGQWMFVANQDGGDVVVFKIDTTTGRLTPTGTRVEVPRCVCVKFLAKE
ncbi:MAG: lactonase family protein [Bacteroidales bacterium]|nr:lactonase family protein [Bacteroidales bacterium]